MKLFISYARVDKPLCKQIVNHLDVVHEVWYDRRLHAGMDWWQEIQERLSWAEGFVYLLSPEAVSSEYCQKEFAIAQDSGKHIFPVLIQARTSIPTSLSHLQYADLSQGMEDIATLLNAITIAERQQREPKPSQSASKSVQPPSEVKPANAVSEAAEAMDTKDFDKAVFVLKAAIGQNPEGRIKRILENMLEEADKALEEQSYHREAQREYAPIAELVKRNTTRGMGCTELSDFLKKYPNYDPEGLQTLCKSAGSSTAPAPQAGQVPASDSSKALAPTPGDNFASVKIIGIGGGGGNTINRLIQDGKNFGAELIAINTDNQALMLSKARIRVRIGDKLTRGLGGGGNPDIGRKAAEESADELFEVLRGADVVYIAAGMGGGTGTGAAPIVAQVAKELGALVIAMVTRPFTFEGQRRNQIAETGIQALKKQVDGLIVIDNNKLLQTFPKNASLSQAYGFADEALMELISILSLVDFANLRRMFSSEAQLFMGQGKAQDAKLETVIAVIKELLEPFGEAHTVIMHTQSAGELGYGILDDVTKLVHSTLNPSAELLFQSSVNENLAQEVKITLLGVAAAKYQA